MRFSTDGSQLGDVHARRALDVPTDAPLLAIIGRAASGKTETLARRCAALFARDPSLTHATTIVTAPSAHGAAALAVRIDELLPVRREVTELDRRYFGSCLERLAFDILTEHGTATGLVLDPIEIDAFEAEEIFRHAIAPLFSADWSEYLGPDIDPEIPGLRAPDRFATAVLRLIRKLRAAHISPDAFLQSSLRGATQFYANPPNLCAPALLLATKDEHRGSLAVSSIELERQRRRELDLAKIITKIYRSYLDRLTAQGVLTADDAIAEATRVLGEHPALARAYRQRFRVAFIDDVHDLRTGEFCLLRALFGPTLPGVTVAGDPESATQTFAGARPERVFGAAALTLTIQANDRIPAGCATAIAALLDPTAVKRLPPDGTVRTFRAATPSEEARFVADSIAALVAGGTAAGRIAVLHRSLRTLSVFEDALVERDISIALRGDAALFTRHDALDALAVLWAVVDPFAHAWLLRVLQLPLLRLSDATIAMLCGEPANPQAALFDLPAQERDAPRRWDRRRDLRLGTNVVRGDRDADLPADARARLTSFRERRLRWQQMVLTANVAQAATTIVGEAGLLERQPDETPARARRRATFVAEILATITRFAKRNSGRPLAAALAACAQIANREDGPRIDDRSSDAVVVAAIDDVKDQRFAHVFVVDVRAGSFPPYYVPDAFLFSPTYGMIPKDSVGEAVSLHTAKFTWYSYQAKLRENYCREDRRALAVALGRADTSVTISAAGRPTRGVGAPELLVELATMQATKAAATIGLKPAGGPLKAGRLATPASSASLPLSPLETTVPALPAIIDAQRLAAQTRCVACASYRAIDAALGATPTLLSSAASDHAHPIIERDIAFALPVEGAIVFGTIPALVRHDTRLYVALTRPDATLAALGIRALHERVESTAYFIETANQVFAGPQVIEIDRLLCLAADVVSARATPLCSEHHKQSSTSKPAQAR